jgi:DNA-binding NarL/FixJ family response regulator
VGVLVVEDHRLMFEGLISVLSEFGDINVAGVATTVADAVRKATVIKPDLVLMDYRLPDGDGVDATTKIRALLPDTAVLFLSADVSEAAMMRAVEAGASGYVSKGAAAEDLVAGIRKAAEGEFLLEAATMSRLIEARRKIQRAEQGQQRLDQKLTALERDVLKLLARGLGNGEIADELRVNYGTVRGQVRGLLEKLDAQTRTEAVATARRVGLVEA